MDRTELLKRWAELAPEECLMRDGAPYLRAEFYSPKRVDLTEPAYLLSALIEAIRKRGWPVNLHVGEDDGAICIFHGDQWKTGICIKESEPCDALLSAYLQALEASRG